MPEPCRAEENREAHLLKIMTDDLTRQQDNRVSMAVLSTALNNEIPENTPVKTIELHPVKIKFDDFHRLMFNTKIGIFKTDILNKLFPALGQSFSLLAMALEATANLNSLYRENINTDRMIAITKRCAFRNVTEVVQYVSSMNTHDLNIAISSLEIVDAEAVVDIHMKFYFPEINVVIEVVFVFIVTEVPERLVRNTSHYEYQYNFELIEDRAIPRLILVNKSHEEEEDHDHEEEDEDSVEPPHHDDNSQNGGEWCPVN